MKTILVATDFSGRSDLALARGARLAARARARLHLVHVVDDDQSRKIFEGEAAISRQLLDEQLEQLRDVEGLECSGAVVPGDAFQGILDAAETIGADLAVIGAHRRHLLRDVFVGTTAQRTIRRAQLPVLMVNAPPARAYGRVVLATDLSENSRNAAESFVALDLADAGQYTLLHVFDAPVQLLTMRDVLTSGEQDRYLADLQADADRALAGFDAPPPLSGGHRIARPYNGAISHGILEAAADLAADLIVVASQGRSGLAKIALGSVAEDVLSRAERDVLVIPPRRHV